VPRMRLCLRLIVLIFGVLMVSKGATGQKIAYAGGLNTCSLMYLNNTKCWGEGGHNGNENNLDVGASANTMGIHLPSINWGAGLQPKVIAMGGPSQGSGTLVCAVVAPTSSPTSAVVKCFGSNEFGKGGRGFPYSGGNMTFGDETGEMLDANFPSINLGTGMIPSSVAVGSNHACAIVSTSNLSTDRKVKCWGKGSTGALGNGGTLDKGTSSSDMGDSLLAMGLSNPALQIAAGLDFTCVITSASSTVHGDVYCTGLGASGQTGQNANVQISAPGKVPLGAKTARKIVAGNTHVCALIHQDNQLMCWGEATDSRIGINGGTNIGDTAGELPTGLLDFGGGRTVSDVSAGADFTCVLLSDNTVKCFGNNLDGKLGISVSDQVCQCEPCKLNAINCQADTVADLKTVNLGLNVVAQSLALGSAHACAIVTGNFPLTGLKCWGRNAEGQLGYENAHNYGDTFADIGDGLPFVQLDEITVSPSTSPTTSRPSVGPSPAPSTTRPSRNPSTSRPSQNPSRMPTNSPSRSKAPTSAAPTTSPTPQPTRNPTRIPTTRAPITTQAPTEDAGAAATRTIGVAVGASVGAVAFALFAFVLWRRGGKLFTRQVYNAAPTNWYQEALSASPNAPPNQALTAAARAAAPKGGNKYNAPPQAPVPVAAPVYESGNPVYQGIRAGSSPAGSAGARQSVGAPLQPLSADAIMDKLSRFYAKFDPNKPVGDLHDLVKFVQAKGEEALYAKLRKKYGADPNSMQSTTFKLTDDVNI
jgi:hypothetical protein